MYKCVSIEFCVHVTMHGYNACSHFSSRVVFQSPPLIWLLKKNGTLLDRRMRGPNKLSLWQNQEFAGGRWQMNGTKSRNGMMRNTKFQMTCGRNCKRKTQKISWRCRTLNLELYEPEHNMFPLMFLECSRHLRPPRAPVCSRRPPRCLLKLKLRKKNKRWTSMRRRCLAILLKRLTFRSCLKFSFELIRIL